MAGNRPWTAAEDKFLYEHCDTWTPDEIAKYLGRSRAAVTFRALRTGNKIKIFHRRCSYQKALPEEQWYKAELFLSALSNVHIPKGEHANIELKRLRGALLRVEKQMNR